MKWENSFFSFFNCFEVIFSKFSILSLDLFQLNLSLLSKCDVSTFQQQLILPILGITSEYRLFDFNFEGLNITVLPISLIIKIAESHVGPENLRDNLLIFLDFSLEIICGFSRNLIKLDNRLDVIQRVFEFNFPHTFHLHRTPK